MRSFLSAVWLVLTLKCEHSSRHISEGLDDELSKAEQWAVRMHFLTCTSCRRFRNCMEVMRVAASRLAEASDEHLEMLIPKSQLSTEARQRIAKAMEKVED